MQVIVFYCLIVFGASAGDD